MDIATQVANELSLPAQGVAAVVALLADGNTVPFIARYRKEATGGLDEVQIRAIEERRGYLVELADRKKTVLESIDGQGKLTAELRARIEACTGKAELEDLYLPYKPRRRTRATIARERGLEPLAERILAQPDDGDPAREAAAFVDPGKDVPDVDAALAGARDIAAENVAERAEVRAAMRTLFNERGEIVSKKARGVEGPTKFEQYYEFREPVRTIPSHRFLAIRRGENENVLKAGVEVDVDRAVAEVERLAGVRRASPWSAQLIEAVSDSYKRLIAPSIETQVRTDLKLRSDAAAVEVFAENLRNLLMAAPLGPRAVIGIDPGLRTGCKCVAVDATGQFLGNITIYLVRGDSGVEAAKRELGAFIDRHQPIAIAVGNGTGGRETEAFVRALLRERAATATFTVQVSESGASVYSASDVAREEFPDLDLTVRGAISIARRLQDPLAELVKLDPKVIGVGQYQHDVFQPLLARKLGEVVESCVNGVGVELNTASAPLLAHVSGIRASVAQKIVAHRNQKGAFRARRELLAVGGVGPRVYEQAAGFLRIRGGEHPLDASAVHPERYSLVERMASDLGVAVSELLGNRELVRSIDIARYITGDVGEPTLRDIVGELEKPGRDPRKEFEPPAFRDDVNSMTDLEVGMSLEGVVTNVTAFGAFVDVGVHQDGLVHVSQLADRFVKDPAEVVKVGDKIRVRVLEVDLARKRISLTAKKQVEAGAPRPPSGGDRGKGGGDRSRGGGDRGKGGGGGKGGGKPGSFSNNPFAALKNRGR